MIKSLVYGLLAALGVGVGVVLSAVQHRYIPGDPMNGARMFWLWISVVIWVAACGAGLVHDVRRRRG